MPSIASPEPYPGSVVFLALEPGAALEAVGLAQQIGCAVWVGSDAMNEEMHRQLTGAGLLVTRFAYPLASASAETVEDAIATVQEHHPHDVIWVQRGRALRSPRFGKCPRVMRHRTLARPDRT